MASRGSGPEEAQRCRLYPSTLTRAPGWFYSTHSIKYPTSALLTFFYKNTLYLTIVRFSRSHYLASAVVCQSNRLETRNNMQNTHGVAKTSNRLNKHTTILLIVHAAEDTFTRSALPINLLSHMYNVKNSHHKHVHPREHIIVKRQDRNKTARGVTKNEKKRHTQKVQYRGQVQSHCSADRSINQGTPQNIKRQQNKKNKKTTSGLLVELPLRISRHVTSQFDTENYQKKKQTRRDKTRKR